MLTLKNVKKDYPSGENVVRALRGVTLSFRRNEFVSVLGASGCGKTTLLNIIGGLDRYTDGELIIGGVSTKDYTDRDWDIYRNHRVGFVFQSYNLIPHQSVLENVEIALTIAGVAKSERRKRAMETLEKVGLGEELNKRPNQLSGGQMQRVAIARALVNNPEILLADEPTGALDSETSVQIMDLIREIAGERLVIMVTHNPELAEQYSTRIVRLSDGLVVSDTNPCEGEEIEASESTRTAGEKPTGSNCGCEKSQKERAAMSYATALGLSGRNLIAKKARTLITGIAGSIGIIGVSLVLALRGGFASYISATEKDMLSEYPLTISETSLDYAAIMQSLEGSNVNVDISRLDDSIYVNSFLARLANDMMSTNTITQEYLDYLDTVDSNTYYARRLQYGGDIGNNLFTNMSFQTAIEGGQNVKLTCALSLNHLVSMFTDQLEDHAVVGKYQTYSTLFTSLLNVTYEIPNNPAYVLSQYDLVAGEYPDESSETEFMLVLNNDGGMTDLTLAQLGLLSVEDVLELFTKDEDGEGALKYISYEDILAKEYTYYPNDFIYTKTTIAQDKLPIGSWIRDNFYVTKPQQSGTKMKISGILRAKDTTTYGALSSGLAYMPGFTQKYLADCRASDIAVDTAQKEGMKQEVYSQSFTDIASGTGNRYFIQEATLRSLGAEEMPKSIQFFVKDFACKDVLTAHLDRWNNEIKAGDESSQIQYSDTVAVVMLLVRGMLDAVTYVLVAFTAISLIVSSIMIGIITYVSVVERTKEIGVLRSLGARKKDVRNLFNAETFIIGLAAGIIGISSAYLLSIPINAILFALTEINGLAALPFGQALLMVGVSVVLTLISGLLPANAAAKKDPVIALRSE